MTLQFSEVVNDHANNSIPDNSRQPDKNLIFTQVNRISIYPGK